MVKRVNPDDVSGEEEFELRAAFGDDAVDNGDLIELEESDLEPVPDKQWPMEELLEEDDYVVIEHKAGNRTEGPVTEVKSYGFTIDPQNRTTSGFFGYESFGGDKGLVNELVSVNGEPVDVDYDPEVLDE